MRVFLAGHGGMSGTAFLRRLRERSDVDEIILRTRAELDLLDQGAVRDFLARTKPDVIIVAAARVGGIRANDTLRADFLFENLALQTNVINGAFRAGVEKLLFLGSSCIYPRMAEQPIAEESLLTGALEPTNEPYAIAKIAGLKLCESYNRQYGTDYRSVMPTNLYGPFDNFHPEHSHVIPAIVRRFHEAKLAGAEYVEVWGDGTPRREFLHVDDMAAGALFVLDLTPEQYRSATNPRFSFLNLGTGADVSISELAALVRKVVGFEGEIRFDATKPNGTPRKRLDTSRLQALGWTASTSLADGMRSTYQWFCDAAAAGTLRL